MRLRNALLIVSMLPVLLGFAGSTLASEGIRLKDLGRIDGVRDNSLVGYGLVTGLAGTGDSRRSRATLQSVANMLREFGVIVQADMLNSRNVAAVTLTATLPPFGRPGDKLDINVSSLGDARSLLGGTLLLAPLYGPGKKIHALAQGQLSIGGFKYDLNGNVVQKNHPTAGTIPSGAIVEFGVSTRLVKGDGVIDILLFEPDFTTSSRISRTLNQEIGVDVAKAIDAGRIEIKLTAAAREDLVSFLASIESIVVAPDQRARVVVNERTGTVVSGGDVKISKVTVSHGDLRVSIVTDFLVSQPGESGILVEPGLGVRTAVVPSTRIEVEEGGANTVSLPSGTSVADLVASLNKIKTSTRDIITILEGIKRAGALHAELLIQ